MRRRHRFRAIGVVLGAGVLLAGGCSSDAPDDTRPAPTTSAGAPPSTVVNSPPNSTTTEASAPPRSACPASPPLRTIDIDGDEAIEGVWLDVHPGGQRLTVCGNSVQTGLELPLSVWYLATTDVEPDGTHELWLGANEYGDTIEQPHANLRRIVLGAGGSLRPEIIDDWIGLEIGPAAGAGCVDVDADGIRELVELGISADDADPDTVRWSRSVSGLVPTDVTDERVGSFDRVADSYAISLLTTFSCGDDLVPLERVSPPSTICDDDRPFGFALAADLDGDGLDDVVVQRRAMGDAFLRGTDDGWLTIAVCLSSGVTDELPVGGMGEIFDVSHGPDGHPVIWTGGTTVSGAYRSALVVHDGRLTYVREADGPAWPFGLWDGLEFGDSGPRYGRSGCREIAGVEHFVQIEGTIDGDRLPWTQETWTFDGLFVNRGPATTGQIDLPADFDPDLDGWDVLAPDLTDACG